MAYCRTTTLAPARSSCPEPCDYQGIALFWPRAELHYTFNASLFPGLSEAQVRSIFEKSFGKWQSIQCWTSDANGGAYQTPIGFQITADEQTTDERDGHVASRDPAANKNVIFHLSREEWAADPELPRRAFAVTSVWFNDATGEILGADMQFNGTLDPFGICPADTGCTATDGDPTNDGTVDLQNVATHEAGHFLGLAHSADEDSTMSCDASPGDVNKRTLGQDDIDGMCDAYPPGESFKGPTKQGSGSSGASCALSETGGESNASAALSALALLALFRRRRR